MGIELPGRMNRSLGRSALHAPAVFALAATVLFCAAWAKASRYDLRAVPSPYFSKSVKIARILFVNGLSDEPFAMAAANPQLPEPDWNGIAPLPAPVTAIGAPPLPFQRFRAPPTVA